MNDPQYMGLNDLRDWINTVPRDLSDQEIKGVLLRLIQAIKEIEYAIEPHGRNL